MGYVKRGALRGNQKAVSNRSAITVTLTNDGGASVNRLLGQIALQGFGAPHVRFR